MNQSYSLWIPVELSFLRRQEKTDIINTIAVQQVKKKKKKLLVISSISKYLHYRSPIDINGVVVHHLHNGHTEVAPDPEGDAEAQAAEDGDDVALGQAKTATVQQRGRTRGRRHWTPIFCQFYIVLFLYIASIYFSMRAKKK